MMVKQNGKCSYCGLPPSVVGMVTKRYGIEMKCCSDCAEKVAAKNAKRKTRNKLRLMSNLKPEHRRVLDT